MVSRSRAKSTSIWKSKRQGNGLLCSIGFALVKESRSFYFCTPFHVHEYTPSADYQDFFRADDAGDLDRFLTTLRNKKLDATDLPATDIQAGIDAYDSALREADAAVEQLVNTLQDRGLWQNTMLILTSDHGEEFVEHGRLGHGRTLFQEMLHVPLLIHAPGMPPKNVTENVSVIQIAPTVLDFLQLPPSDSQDGESLLDWGSAPPEEPPFVAADLNITADNRWRVGIKENFKFVEQRDDSLDTPLD